jgi:opacity protein-like surface antigen
MKKIGVLAVVMAAAFLLVGVASAEMYVEGYLGAAFTPSIGQTVNVKDIQSGPAFRSAYNMKWAGNVPTVVIGGVKVGTWFVKEGTLGYSGYPDWCKYFGFYTDFSYQRLYTSDQSLTGTDKFGFSGTNIGRAVTNVGFLKTEGMVASWAFMLSARYGFFQDSEVPFGRLQPYIGVGPAIMFSSMKPKGLARIRQAGDGIDLNINPGSQSSTDIALAVDGGVRYMALKNVSFDISFKWRYAQPHYTFQGQNGTDFVPARFSINPTYNLLSTQVGVAYHF